ncbi:MAG TPA: EamA family transporter, partial [Candidatus Saccharimonadales bacterium]
MIKKSSPLGAEALFLAALLYATTGALVREMGHMWSNNAQVAARSIVVLVILLIYSAFRKSKGGIPKDKLPYAIGLGLLFATSMILFTWAFQKTTLSNTYLTSYATNIIISFLLGTFILKEDVSHRKVVAIALCLIGLLFYTHAILSGTTGITFSILSGIVGGF